MTDAKALTLAVVTLCKHVEGAAACGWCIRLAFSAASVKP